MASNAVLMEKAPPADGTGVWSGMLPRLGLWIDAHGGFCLLFLLALYTPTAVLEAKAHLLGNDELFTLRIAVMPTVTEMLRLAKQIDLHPPLTYFTERWAMQLGALLHGPRWFFAMLPSLIAGFVATAALFRFTARRLGNLLALFAVGVLWLGPIFELSWRDRSYMQWVAWLALLLLAWDAARSPRRKAWAIPAVLLCAVGTVSCHIYGASSLLPFFVAAVVDWKRTRRADPLLWLALALPCLITVSYLSQVHGFGTVIFPAERMPTLGAIGTLYVEMVGYFAGAMLIFTILMLALPQRELDRPAGVSKPDAVDLALLLTLAAVPAMLGIASILLHMEFFGRYGCNGVLAIAVLTAWFLARRVAASRTLATILAVALPFACLARVMMDVPGSPGMHPELADAVARLHLDPALPIVAADGLTYVEMNDREPAAILPRIYYLTDTPLAIQYSHSTIFETEQIIHDIFHLPAPVEPMQSFLREHNQFYVIGSYNFPEDWILKALIVRGATVGYLGQFDSAYKDDDSFADSGLYLVTLAGPVGCAKAAVNSPVSARP
jgi:hypothetical protein